MLRQYSVNAWREGKGKKAKILRKVVARHVQAGDYVTVEVGSRSDYAPRRGLHNKAIVLGWLNREYTAHHKDESGHWQSVFILGGHLAEVRMLHNGEVRRIAEQWLIPLS